MSSLVFKIDWNAEFQEIDAVIRARGGVVRIDHAGEISAWQQFDARLKQAFGALSPSAMSIRIDAHWHSTRFLVDILDVFDRKLAAAGLPSTTLARAHASDVRVLTDNSFAGDADVHVGQVHFHGPSHQQQATDRNARVASVCERLRVLLDRGDHVMVVLHHGSFADQAQFWRDFWARGLRDMVPLGMVFAYYVQDGDVSYEAPIPDLILNLPQGFSEGAREDAAYDDLIDLMMSLDVSADMASGLATAHLNSNKGSMKAFYNNLMPLIMKVRTAGANRGR